MKKYFSWILVLAFLTPSVSLAAPLTQAQAESLINVVKASPGTPASAFTDLITSFSNITVGQAESLIGVIQASPNSPATAFVNLLESFTQDTQPVVTTPNNVSTNTNPDFTLPNGAVTDSNGNIVQQAPQVQSQAPNNAEINELMNDYYTQKNALDQQIVNIKSKYYMDLNNDQNVGATVDQHDEIVQRLTDQANLQIEEIQNQEEQLNIDYQNKIEALQ